MKLKITMLICFLSLLTSAQDLSQGYIANDLANHPMQAINKPGFLDAITDPSFTNTTIRRITNTPEGTFMVPIYSTIQAWNADESLMIIYGNGKHQLLNGKTYEHIRVLDIVTDDVETVYWHFTDPNILFYHDANDDFVSYNVNTLKKTVLVNLADISSCDLYGITEGNDGQMMSWDSDVISFRCQNTTAYYYRISTKKLTQFNISDIGYMAPMPFPSGNLFYHKGKIYDTNGDFVRNLTVSNGVEHACLGKLSNGDDAYFAIAFAEGASGGCLGTLVANNATNGNCFSVTPVANYGYSMSGTHISALAHKNTEGGWVAVSMMGSPDVAGDQDGQNLFEQEIFIAKVNENNADIYRVAHHRSDENEIDYWGEPHVTISPSGTRLLFASDWSGSEDGYSVDSYVAELNANTLPVENITLANNFTIYPNPVNNTIYLTNIEKIENYKIYSFDGKKVAQSNLKSDKQIDISTLSKGIYIIKFNSDTASFSRKFIK